MPNLTGNQMHKFASFNFRLATPQKINLHALSSAALYGKGIFTTIAVYSGKPFLWDRHWNRLTENAARLALDLSSFSESAVKEELLKLIRKNETFNARARLTFFDESASEIWKVNNDRKVSLLITTAEFRHLPEKISLTVSPYPVNSRSPLVNIKSCNYFENILAFRAAAVNGFGEAVRLNEKDEIVSACLANIFWMKAQKLYTPALKTGALAGTTRKFILDNFVVCETHANLEEIRNAETVFLTSAGFGVVEVKSFEQISYESNGNLEAIKKLLKQSGKAFAESDKPLDS